MTRGGALESADGTSAMSHVDFKKSQCRMSSSRGVRKGEGSRGGGGLKDFLYKVKVGDVACCFPDLFWCYHVKIFS